ncbi:hypothetical protein [Pseudomonas sp. SWRI179]|uniref:hypothetical protein n=1 Tax=Pseudomonas sp. SWRI179 TaxID=2745497 RepID=UPI001648B50E|nr:hypothetical protein [Pseudomonas sp. SWRI179]MBC3385084.1 hypothetical protein [Pseudomonas sp. SWRI179]
MKLYSPCGSGLARESGGSDGIDAECAAAFASKPAPTGFLVIKSIFVDVLRGFLIDFGFCDFISRYLSSIK